MYELNRPIADYAFDHYLAADVGLCSLCGNTGIIDTRATAVSPAGYHAGRLNWCLCPNGQVDRQCAGGRLPTEDDLRRVGRMDHFKPQGE